MTEKLFTGTLNKNQNKNKKIKPHFYHISTGLRGFVLHVDFSLMRKHAHEYTAVFHGCKNNNFQIKMGDLILICAQNIDCGYMLERRF